MSWFRVNQGACRDERIEELAILLGMDEDAALARVVRLWDLGSRESIAGDLSHVPPRRVAIALRHKGDPRDLLDALVEVGILSRDGDSLSVAGWLEMWGRDDSKRAKDAERLRTQRDMSRDVAATSRDVAATSQRRSGYVTDERNATNMTHETDERYHVHSAPPGTDDIAPPPEGGESGRETGHVETPLSCPPSVQDPTREDHPPVPAPPPPARRPRGLTQDQQAAFDHWYRAYPRKEARAAAEKAFLAAVKEMGTEELTSLVEQMVDSVHSATAAGKYADVKFTPLPATWINGKRWLDDHAQPTRASPIPKKHFDIATAFLESFGGAPGSGPTIDITAEKGDYHDAAGVVPVPRSAC